MPRILLFLALLLAGCGPARGPDSDPTQAAALLRTALDAWKAGTAPTALQAHRPPIWFNEPDCRGACKLLNYRLQDGPTMYGRQVRVVARLTLQPQTGKTVDRTIAYLVDTTPNCVIARDGL